MSEDDALDLEIKNEDTETEAENQEKSVWKKKIENELSKTEKKSKDEKEEWLKKVEEDRPDDPKEDHRIMSRALENPIRRKIMKFIGKNNSETASSIGENFDISESEAKVHLGFLEQALIAEKVENELPVYRLTIRGEKFLENI